MITDAHLEQLLRDERDSFGEPDAALLDRVVEVPVFERPEPVAPVRRRRVRSLLVAFALLVPLVVAVVVVAGRRSDPAVGPTAATTTIAETIRLHAQVVGTWQLAGVDTNAATYRDRPVVRFDDDGTWSGSDGCNGIGGTWRVTDAGAFVADSGFQSLIGCNNVNYAAMLNAAGSVEVDGDRLVLLNRDSPARVTLIRDPLALPEAPAAGWLPGYSFFQADRVVTDQTLIDRFAKVRKGQPTPPDGGPFTPPVLWYLGRVAGIDNYLVVFRSDHVCVAQVLVQNDRGAGSRCTTRDAMNDALAPLGDPTAMVVSDAVRSVVAESADGTKTAYRVRDNFAFGEPKDAPEHLVVTLADGRSRDVLANPKTLEPPGTTSERVRRAA